MKKIKFKSLYEWATWVVVVFLITSYRYSILGAVYKESNIQGQYKTAPVYIPEDAQEDSYGYHYHHGFWDNTTIFVPKFKKDISKMREIDRIFNAIKWIIIIVPPVFFLGLANKRKRISITNP